ncbi:hypothetical protein KDA23_01080 [Candidatus Saccharibacteria bacterium]|nr:hypothetical protein [Candidatus Saccharibacteria bacterium]
MAKITPIKAPASAGGDFEIAPEGVFLARCYKMVDVGTQTETSQFGTKENRKIYLYWELLQDADGGDAPKTEQGQPFSIFNSYKLSMHQKANLRKHLDSWRGKKFTEEEAADFDITKLLDKFCLIQIGHSTSKDGQKTYANVDNIMHTKKTATGVNEISSFNAENPDMEVFNDLPEWLQNKIEDSPEWQDTDQPEEAQAAPADKEEDKIDIADVPF